MWGRMLTSPSEPPKPCGVARTFGEKKEGSAKAENLEERGWRSSPEDQRGQSGAVEVERKWSVELGISTLFFFFLEFYKSLNLFIE